MKAWIVLLCSLLSFSLWAGEGKITLEKGQGTIKVNGSVVELPAQVSAGDLIETSGEKSFVLITYPLGDKILIKNGSLRLQQTVNNDPNVELERGDFFSYVVPKKGRRVRFKSKHTSMGVRGTKFMVSAKDEYTYLCVCEGKVWIKNNKDGKELSPGEDTEAKSAGKISVHQASSPMWSMAQEGFQLMDLPIGERPKP